MLSGGEGKGTGEGPRAAGWQADGLSGASSTVRTQVGEGGRALVSTFLFVVSP